GEQTFYFLDFIDEGRVQRFVEIAWLAQMREEFLRLTTVRVVTVQDLTQDCFRPGVITLRDPRFSQNDGAFASAFRRLVMRFSRNDCVRQIADGSFKFLVRDAVILRFHGGLAARQRGFAVRYGSLTPLNLAVGNVVGVLRKRGGR
ncbi:MAG TPA: hypothetical protein VN825_04315, partial [Candidatus Acidoferrum sp.]|nr:hypothetical protein [Candidatus Acidoferrum sp.]